MCVCRWVLRACVLRDSRVVIDLIGRQIRHEKAAQVSLYERRAPQRRDALGRLEIDCTCVFDVLMSVGLSVRWRRYLAPDGFVWNGGQTYRIVSDQFPGECFVNGYGLSTTP